MKRRLRFILALLLVAASASPTLAQGEAGFEPVPAQNLSDGTLTVPAENFSIKAPAKHWEWLRGVQAVGSIGKNYLCRNSATGVRFFLTVSEPSPGSVEKLAEGMLEGMRKSQEAKGRRVVDARYEPADIPAPGSYRLSAKITTPETTVYFIGYALAANRFYAVQVYSETPKEPEAFTAFAKSFTLATPVATSSKSGASDAAFALCLYVAILAVFLGGGALVNALARRPLVSGGLVAFVLILIVATLRMSGELAGTPSAERIGYYVGEALLPALVAAWAHSRYTKKKLLASRSPA